MDKSNEYIRMCKSARVVQLYKWEKGYDESDFLWTGEKVIIIGHDHLHVSQGVRNNGRGSVRFMLYREIGAVNFLSNYGPDGPMQVRDGEYIIADLAHPVWLPRVDQLQNICLIEKKWSVMETYNSFTTWLKKYSEKSINCSFEQLWFMFVMKEVFNRELKNVY